MSYRRRSDLLQLLRQRLEQLKSQVREHDHALPGNTSQALDHQQRFHSALFDHTGASLAQCLQRLEQDLAKLDRLSQASDSGDTFELVCQQFSDRYQAVTQALATTGLQAAGARFSSRRRSVPRQDSQYQWIARSVMQNSHSAYAELRKHQNWADRLQQKIHELEQKLDLHQGAEKIKLQNEILTTQKRLGRCRQAMTYIEERIARLEQNGQRY
ncbi:primosomal replication protein [Ferrimonas sediminicola]|uniref:primosomal replication protein n=1 Tax=Ferrimonas sediminicola TaxID=2569538 RepID=UPI00145E855C|nr:primosomal replication protein [Ferrimonas sediminicola]